MNRVLWFKRLTYLFFGLFLTFLILSIAGCTAAQNGQAAAAAQSVHDITTQPAVQVLTSAVPEGTLITGIISLVSLLAAGFFKAQQSAAQSHLDTAQAATGTTSNSAAMAALVNNLDTTPVSSPSSSAVPIAVAPVVSSPVVAPAVVANPPATTIAAK